MLSPRLRESKAQVCARMSQNGRDRKKGVVVVVVRVLLRGVHSLFTQEKKKAVTMAAVAAPRPRGITAAAYKELLAANYPDGNVPQPLPPPMRRVAKHPRKFACTHCNYATTTKGLLRRHQADIHDLNVIWHACTFTFADGNACPYRGKSTDDVQEHLRKAHNVGVKWHVCDQEGCTFQTKTASALVKHKANRHDIDVVWHNCMVPGCGFVCKQRGNLLQHARWMHSGRKIINKTRVALNRVPLLLDVATSSDDEMDDEPPIVACVPCATSDDTSEPSLSAPSSPSGDDDDEPNGK